MRDRPIIQNRPRIPREELPRRVVPRRRYQAHRQISLGGGPDRREEYRDQRDGKVRRDHCESFAASSCVPLNSAHLQNLEASEIEKIVAQIEAEKEAEAERKRQRVAQTQAGQASMAMGTSAVPSGAVSGSQTPAAGGAGAGTEAGSGEAAGTAGDATGSGIQ